MSTVHSPGRWALSVLLALAGCKGSISAAPPQSPPQRAAAEAQTAASPSPSTALVSYDAFKRSEFVDFFGLRERDRQQRGAVVTAEWRPGRFGDAILMTIDLDGAERVTHAALSVSRGWLGEGTSLNPFGVDLVASFVSEFASPVDLLGAAMNDLALAGPSDRADRIVLLRDGSSRQYAVSPEVRPLLEALGGRDVDCVVRMRDRMVHVANVRSTPGDAFSVEVRPGSA